MSSTMRTAAGEENWAVQRRNAGEDEEGGTGGDGRNREGERAGRKEESGKKLV
jgi:hypothetical protein